MKTLPTEISSIFQSPLGLLINALDQVNFQKQNCDPSFHQEVDDAVLDLVEEHLPKGNVSAEDQAKAKDRKKAGEEESVKQALRSMASRGNQKAIELLKEQGEEMPENGYKVGAATAEERGTAQNAPSLANAAINKSDDVVKVGDAWMKKDEIPDHAKERLNQEFPSGNEIELPPKIVTGLHQGSGIQSHDEPRRPEIVSTNTGTQDDPQNRKEGTALAKPIDADGVDRSVPVAENPAAGTDAAPGIDNGGEEGVPKDSLTSEAALEEGGGMDDSK